MRVIATPIIARPRNESSKKRINPALTTYEISLHLCAVNIYVFYYSVRVLFYFAEIWAAVNDFGTVKLARHP